MSKLTKKPPLTFAEYQRLHNVIHSLALNWKNDVGRSCVFFSITGAALMHKHYKRNAKVICGGGAVMLDHKTEAVLSWFTLAEDGSLKVAPEAFHAWIECDGWLIDLMAPNYRESMIGVAVKPIGYQEGEAPAVSIPPRKMLIKQISRTEGSFNDMKKSGDCVFVGDRDITTSIIDRAFERPQFGDILHIAQTWHRPFPEKMSSSITITDDLGELTTIKLIKRELVGAW